MPSAEFDAAAAQAKTFTKSPTNDELLELYALFKQATVGDVSGPAPGMFDLKGKAKYAAWEKIKGTSSADAETKYIALVKELNAKYQ
ncbi:Acyl-CoA-binding domain-containing protein 1 [Mortierella sp. AM989]|nr:Acyl-CoA-binding domain-containing protein 1 [Mortierella sp. AM989]